MSSAPQEISVEEQLASMRSQIIISYDNAKEKSLRIYDIVSKKYYDLLVEKAELAKAEKSSKVKESKSKDIKQ